MAHIFKSVNILKIFEISRQYHDIKNKSQKKKIPKNFYRIIKYEIYLSEKYKILLSGKYNFARRTFLILSLIPSLFFF